MVPQQSMPYIAGECLSLASVRGLAVITSAACFVCVTSYNRSLSAINLPNLSF